MNEGMTTNQTRNPLAAYLPWQDNGTTMPDAFIAWALTTREA